jgi:hypothetical protein
VFINQDIVVYPKGEQLPDNFKEVVEFLFGEGACIKQDVVNSPSVLKIKGASFVLSGVKTINADWVCQKIEQD